MTACDFEKLQKVEIISYMRFWFTC